MIREWCNGWRLGMKIWTDEIEFQSDISGNCVTPFLPPITIGYILGFLSVKIIVVLIDLLMQYSITGKLTRRLRTKEELVCQKILC